MYYLRSADGQAEIASRIVGTSQPKLALFRIRQIEVPNPPLKTQRKIAAILSAYDDLIENNTRRIAIVEEMARLLYSEWFLEFRFPGHESVEMVDSPLGAIPEGWEVKQVGDIATLSRGRSYASSNLVNEGGMPFLNLKCINRGGGFRSEGIKWYEGPYKDGQTAKAGDVIIAVTDMTQERRIVAHAARVPRNEYPLSVVSMDLVKLLPQEGIPTAYLCAMLRYSDFPDEVKQFANGVNVLHLNPERILEYAFSLPAPHALRLSEWPCRYRHGQLQARRRERQGAGGDGPAGARPRPGLWHRHLSLCRRRPHPRAVHEAGQRGQVAAVRAREPAEAALRL
jgi:type I restriction enzyme S subunit